MRARNEPTPLCFASPSPRPPTCPESLSSVHGAEGAPKGKARWGPRAQREAPLGKQHRHVYKHPRVLCLPAPDPTHSRPPDPPRGRRREMDGIRAQTNPPGFKSPHLACTWPYPSEPVPVCWTDSATAPCCCEATVPVRRLAGGREMALPPNPGLLKGGHPARPGPRGRAQVQP